MPFTADNPINKECINDLFATALKLFVHDCEKSRAWVLSLDANDPLAGGPRTGQMLVKAGFQPSHVVSISNNPLEVSAMQAADTKIVIDSTTIPTHVADDDFAIPSIPGKVLRGIFLDTMTSKWPDMLRNLRKYMHPDGCLVVLVPHCHLKCIDDIVLCRHGTATQELLFEARRLVAGLVRKQSDPKISRDLCAGNNRIL